MSTLNFPPSQTADEGKENVGEVVKFYKSNRKKHNESQTTQSFIEPLFRALGWHTTDPNEFTVQEKIGKFRVDFGVYLDGWPMFYVETKRPEKANSLEAARQSINYSYLRGVTWAVLTDFEWFKTFNADFVVNNPEDAQFLNLHWETYTTTSFDDLWMLSKPAMAQIPRSLDLRAENLSKKAKRLPVTALLHQQLSTWRVRLFHNIRSHAEPKLAGNPDAIDSAIQKLFDRLIFLRSVEDRHIERERPLKQVLHETSARQGNIWPELLSLFRDMNNVYDSNLFEPHTLDDLQVYDPDLVRDIISQLYSPNRYLEYDFSIISADVLGRVYEQFLSSKSIDAYRESESTKRLKRQSQGIFYTPPYIVQGIIKLTIERCLKEGTPLETIRIVDPACGSGSFLIQAFDTLDAEYRKREPHADTERQVAWRKHILLENLYGVDLDREAVEITRLNLLLRAALNREKLPPVDHIAHGDSLKDVSIDGFDWHRKFRKVFEAGGFDIVIGNPPYVRQERLSVDWKIYATQSYETSKKHAVDLYVTFIEQGIRLLKADGLLGYIVPNKWMKAAYGQALRDYLTSKIENIIDFGELPVFEEASTFPCILIAKNTIYSSEKVSVTRVHDLNFSSLSEYIQNYHHYVSRSALSSGGWMLARSENEVVFTKMQNNGTPLKDYIPTKIYYGIKTGLNEAFVISDLTKKYILRQDPHSDVFIKPFIVGDDVRHHQINSRNQYLILIPSGWTQKNTTESDMTEEKQWSWLMYEYPAIATHLSAYKSKASLRTDKGDYWWELRSCAYYERFEHPKIIYPDISKDRRFVLDSQGYYFGNTVYFIPGEDLYLLGVLNSQVVFNYFKHHANVLGDAENGGRLRWFKQDVEKIPVPSLDLSNQKQKVAHDKIVSLVEEVIILHQRRASIDILFAEEKRFLQQQINHAEAEIDLIVGSLYGLADEDMKLIVGDRGLEHHGAD